MHPDASNRDHLRSYLHGVRDALQDPRLQGDIDRAAEQIAGAGTAQEKVERQLGLDIDQIPSSGGEPEHVPFFARAPMASLVQSHFEEAKGTDVVDPSHPESLWSRLVRKVERELGMEPGSFTSDDPDWFVFFAKGVLERVGLGNAPFNRNPAEFDLADDARLVLVGDWGTGLPRAQDVAVQMQNQIASALSDGRQVHVIHLGDVYYSGLETEDRRHFLEYWPVTGEQADAGAMSWSLNGNHDMYSGGFGYFDTLLADPRFSNQRSEDGRATSYFRLKGSQWDFIGLDSAWNSDVMFTGATGVLEDPQADYIAGIAADPSRKLVLLSHHQLVSVYDPRDQGPELELSTKLRPVLAGDRVTAWWWGHEHRAITYGPSRGVQYPRCLGNGGMPLPPDPDPPAGSEPQILWRSTRVTVEDGHEWARSGFAVLDLHGDRIDVQYIDDDGVCTHTEQIP